MEGVGHRQRLGPGRNGRSASRSTVSSQRRPSSTSSTSPSVCSASHFNLASGTDRRIGGQHDLPTAFPGRATRPSEELENVGRRAPTILRLEATWRTIVYDYPDQSSAIDRWNGRPSRWPIFIIKESQANTVEVCERNQGRAIEEASRRTLNSGPVSRSSRSSSRATRFVTGLASRSTDSGLQGGILALFVLLFFLQRRLRLTGVIAACRSRCQHVHGAPLHVLRRASRSTWCRSSA